MRSPYDERPAAEAFLDHCGIVPRGPDRDLMHELGVAFSRLPYENLTKLIKKHSLPPGPERRRLPQEVITDHLAHGTGGTCFALTRLFSAVLERLCLASFPVLCHARHRRDGHCALVVLLDGDPHLVDPGYLVHEPLPLTGDGVASGAARVVAADRDDGTFELFTHDVLRYRFHLEPVSVARFEAVWDDSFEWTMMNGLHLCVPRDGGYAYLHNHKLCLRGGASRANLNIRGHELEELAQRFGIAETVSGQALSLLAEARSRQSAAGAVR